MKRLLVGLACLLLSAATLSDDLNDARKRAVGSMVATGNIEVRPDGKVGRYDIDESSKLPPAVIQLIGKTVPQWQFEPVLEGGKPATARSKMSLRVIASPVSGGNYAISITGADFRQELRNATSGAATDQLTQKSMPAPSYPRDLVYEHVTGIVYVLLRVDRLGNVEDASAQQVNLRMLGTDSELASYRRKLALAATSALKHWTFNVPTTGKEADRTFWLARAPVDFNIGGDRIVRYGEWEVYIPGPLLPVPWIKTLPMITNDKLLTENVDATPAGGSVLSEGGLHLVNRINGG